MLKKTTLFELIYACRDRDFHTRPRLRKPMRAMGRGAQEPSDTKSAIHTLQIADATLYGLHLLVIGEAIGLGDHWPTDCHCAYNQVAQHKIDLNSD